MIEKIGAPGRIRTPDPQIRSLVLYPAELPAPGLVAALTGWRTGRICEPIRCVDAPSVARERHHVADPGARGQQKNAKCRRNPPPACEAGASGAPNRPCEPASATLTSPQQVAWAGSRGCALILRRCVPDGMLLCPAIEQWHKNVGQHGFSSVARDRSFRGHRAGWVFLHVRIAVAVSFRRRGRSQER